MNRLIIEAANKFMVDNGQAIQVTAILEKLNVLKEKYKKNKALNEIYLDLYKNHFLSDIKIKFERFRPLVDELAERQGKRIDVQIIGDEIKVNTDKYTNFINTSVHLFRNMVDHGIETEDERVDKEKSQKGNIRLEFKNSQKGNSFIIHISDDGRGIDPEKIKGKVLEMGLKTEEEIGKLKDLEIINLIFLPGFSTKEEVTDVSGRGIGMDAIKAEVESLKGAISIFTKPDKGTQFVILLPLLN